MEDRHLEGIGLFQEFLEMHCRPSYSECDLAVPSPRITLATSLIPEQSHDAT